MIPESRLVYVYCVIHSRAKLSAPKVSPRLPAAAPPRIMRLEGPLWMVVSDVDADRYSEQALVEGLQDLTWVSQCAVGHAAVVQACLPKGTVVPMKLLTIFASDARAASEISARRAEIMETVRRTSGRLEWGVRLVTATRAAPPVRTTQRPRTGRGYLEAKRRLAPSRRRAEEAAQIAERIIDTLARTSSDMRRRESIEQVPGSRVLLDAAWLVPKRSTTTFQRRVRSLAGQARRAGYEIVLTGPWPPYHFVDRGESA